MSDLSLEDPSNNFWSLVYAFAGHDIQVFHTQEDPTRRSKRIIEMASLVVPPNSVVPMKDRWGLFQARTHPLATLPQIEAYINKCIVELKGE